jgi:hypothetical protein
MLDEHQQLAHINPNCSNRSTTAGAASGPSPRITVELPTSGGVVNVVICKPPGIGETDVVATSAFRAFSLDGSVG